MDDILLLYNLIIDTHEHHNIRMNSITQHSPGTQHDIIWLSNAYHAAIIVNADINIPAERIGKSNNFLLPS